ncbi:type VII secretion protein EccB [Mycolicibacterium thermoresistibile]
MGRQPVTRLQVSGYRFVLRRLEHALVRADARMLDDPLRAQSLALIAGAVLTAVAVTGCAVLAVLRPAGHLDSAPIVMERDSGALYVRVGDTLHPALNLASARLVARTPADPQPVTADALARADRGPVVGIAGAPTLLGRPLSAPQATWTICDGQRTALRVGTPLDGDRLATGQAVVVRSAGGVGTYLLYNGARAAVDPRDTAVVRALRIDHVVPQPVSDALLDAIPELPALTAPHIPAAGAPGPAPLSGIPVGSVVRLMRTDTPEYYAILADGVQRIGRIAADLIRFTSAQPHREIATVSAGAIAALPVVDELPVTTFPDRIEATSSPVLCAQWDDVADRPKTTLLLRDSMPRGDEVVLAQADDAGPRVDAVGFTGGQYAYVRATGLTGDGGVAGSLFLVTDAGVVFGVHDEQAAAWLGLPDVALAAPWPMVARLPRGPELSAQTASISRDGVAPR